MRYQQVIVQRLQKLENDVRQLEYDVKRRYDRDGDAKRLKEMREFINDTQELAERTQ